MNKKFSLLCFRVWPGAAWLGEARRGLAVRSKAGLGMARSGRAWSGVARLGPAGLGMARHGFMLNKVVA